MTDKEVLEFFGWSLDCESPLSISHPDGSYANGQAAIYVVSHLHDEYIVEQYEMLMEKYRKIISYKEILKEIA